MYLRIIIFTSYPAKKAVYQLFYYLYLPISVLKKTEAMTLLNKITMAGVLMTSSILANAQTKIIAHRGYSSIAPENTLSAFQKAIEIGADYFELDIHKTKDGDIVVIHDASVDRTSSNNTKGEIAKMTSSDLAAVRVGYEKKFKKKFKNEKLPTLKEALTLAKGKIKVCIEVKVYGVEKKVMQIINEVGVNDGVIIFSFYYPVIARIRQLDKNIPTLYLKGKANKSDIDYATAIEANAIGVGSGMRITREFLDYAHNNGVEVWQWTVDDEGKMKQLIELGIDGLITNFPDRALKIRSALK